MEISLPTTALQSNDLSAVAIRDSALVSNSKIEPDEPQDTGYKQTENDESKQTLDLSRALLIRIGFHFYSNSGSSRYFVAPAAQAAFPVEFQFGQFSVRCPLLQGLNPL